MKKCNKCGYKVISPVHYCPQCGQLLPGESEMVFVGEEEYAQAIKAADSVEVDSKSWNDIYSFYQLHLLTGYAPKGKQFIAKTELAQLRKSNQEYVAAKNINGVNFLGWINCRVSQRHQTKNRYIGFKEYWRQLVKKDSAYDLWFNVLFILLWVSYSIIGFIVLMALSNVMGGWGVLLTLLLAAPFIVGGVYISLEILNH